ncbi:MAG TPA: hypothetical protein VH253_09485 [Phycisphaerae bacterium]|nr:hypothetical protein [Phycisphaerae bacterium]
MRQHLIVSTDANGVPIAEVPFSCMWELVEYLSYQRVSVTYQYQASHFTVSFPRQDAASTQRLLDAWANAPADMLQPA